MHESFQEILQVQKERFKDEKEQVPISEAAVEFALQTQKEKNSFYSENLRSSGEPDEPEQVGKEATKLVSDFISTDLQNIADADYQGFIDVIEENKALLGELPASRRFNKTEQDYIFDVIQSVIVELEPLATTFRRLSFATRDFKKQFKPIKLAASVFGGIPILGGAIQRKIERQERGEERLRGAELRKGRAEVEQIRKQKGLDEESMSEQYSKVQKQGAAQPYNELDDDLSQYTANDMVLGRPVPADFGGAKGKVSGTASASASEEQRDELAAEQRDQFEESKNLWETIAENTEETVDILKESQKNKEGGIADTVGDVAKGALGTGAALGTGKVASKLLGKKGGETVAKKAGGKILGKTLFKSAIKKIPIIGAIAGIGYGLGRLMSGDVTGAALEVGSGLASTVPGVGTAASIGMDAALAAKDLKEAEGVEKEIQTAVDSVEQTAQASPKTMGNAISADLVNIDSKRTNLRMNLETGNLENMMNKMTPQTPSMNNVIAPNNNITNAKTTNMLPDLSNKNIDQTIMALKNVY